MLAEVTLVVKNQAAEQLSGEATQDSEQMQNVLGDPVFVSFGHRFVEAEQGKGGQREGDDPGWEKRQTEDKN